MSRLSLIAFAMPRACQRTCDGETTGLPRIGGALDAPLRSRLGTLVHPLSRRKAMRRLLSTVVPLAAIVALVVAVTAYAGGGSGDNRGYGRTITVVEHATTDTTTDTGAKDDSVGDILTFANDVFDAADAAKVGTDNGSCLRTVKGAAYECTWTTFLSGGQITVEGPFFDANDSTLAITGGTGRFRGARGTMELHARENGAKFAFVFHVTG